MRRGRRRAAALVIVAAGIAAGLLALGLMPEAETPRRSVDWARWRRGPVEARHVYWVGHSLLDSRDAHREGARNVMEEVGRLAEAAGLTYGSFAHTAFGAPLSLNWTGAARTFDRREPSMVTRRQELVLRGARYDTLVMTEAVPIGPTMRAEHGAYYAQRFYCAATRARPDMRVYLYETWSSFDEPEAWSARLEADRADWERLADEASDARVQAPDGWWRRLDRSTPARACEAPSPMFLVPVGRVLARLSDALAREPSRWRMADGAPLTIDRFLANARTEEGSLRHPDADVDAIHPSALGTHIVALVHFATLYRRSPVGLPVTEELAPETAAALQELVWRVVREDPRAGVAAPY